MKALNAKTLTDEYTLAIQRNGTTSQAAQQIRAQMIADFENQGLSAQQANKLVDTYTDTVAANGNTDSGEGQGPRSAHLRTSRTPASPRRQPPAKVDTLIGQIGEHPVQVRRPLRQGVGLVHHHRPVGQRRTGSQDRGRSGDWRPDQRTRNGHVATRPGCTRCPTRNTCTTRQRSTITAPPSWMPSTRSGSRRWRRAAWPARSRGNPSGLGAFDTREWRATQSMIESADAALRLVLCASPSPRRGLSSWAAWATPPGRRCRS